MWAKYGVLHKKIRNGPQVFVYCLIDFNGIYCFIFSTEPMRRLKRSEYRLKRLDSNIIT